MIIVFNVLTVINIFFLIYLLIFNVINILNMNKLRYFTKVNQKIRSVSFGKINSNKIVVISCILALASFGAAYAFLRVIIASAIIAIPAFLLPLVILEIKKINRQNYIRSLLPIYAINLKNQVNRENNIILAMRRTKTDTVLMNYIDLFIKNIDKGLNTYDAFEKLKLNVEVREFSELVDALKMCYMHGGEFGKVLDVYSKQLSEKIVKAEQEKEKSLSSVITLIVMILLNIFLLIYTLKNADYAKIIRTTVIGRVIIDFDVISCIVCLNFIYKMYKMEE